MIMQQLIRFNQCLAIKVHKSSVYVNFINFVIASLFYNDF